jgi:hypothetical protein
MSDEKTIEGGYISVGVLAVSGRCSTCDVGVRVVK